MNKTRKRNYKLFYKSKESGYVYPKEYWHMNNYVQFTIAGTRYREGLEEYVGEFMGRLVPEMDNENDPLAIRVEHTDGHHIGYVPKNMTMEVREFKKLPCDCYCYIERRRDDEGDKYYYALCYVSERPVGE